MTTEYKPVVVWIKQGSVTAHIGKAVQEIELVADLDSIAAALRTMHRTDATPAELLAELVALLTPDMADAHDREAQP